MSSPLTLNPNYAEVIVIGAGVLGAFHAYFAAKKGYKTLLLERNALPTDASTRNFGMVVQSIVEAEGAWAGYAHASREIYQAIQQECDISVNVPGSLYLASTEAERAVLEEFAQLYASVYNCSYLTADEARYRYPFAQTDYCQGALHFANDFTIEPRRLLKQWIPFFTEREHVQYVPYTNVVSVDSAGQQCVVKDARGNTFTAEQVFVCSGADYRTLFPDFFRASGLRICKLQMMQTVPLPPRSLPLSLLSGLSILRYPAFRSTPSYEKLRQQPVDQDLRDYGIHLLFKQAVDGSVIIGDSHEYSDFEDASAGEEYTNCRINEAILRYGKRMLTLPSWEIEQMWNGYYLLHPQREVYTETIDERIHITTGIAGKGMSTGPGFSRQHINAVLG
jgi:D-hydroxyproline dehydrogenase subunit beta